MPRSKFWTIASNEYLRYIRSKSFLITTFILPIIWLIIIILPNVIAVLSFEKTERKIAVVDQTDKKLGAEIVARDSNTFYLESRNIEILNREIVEGKLDGYLLLRNQDIEDNTVELYTKGGGGLGLINVVENTLTDVFRRIRLLEKGIDPSIVNFVLKEVKVETKKVTTEGVQKDYASFYGVVGYIMAFLIYILLFIYGAMVMRGVIEEKASRIIEILLSSARPFDIMFGKILGIGSVGLTQIIIWFVLLGILSQFSTQIISFFVSPSNLPSEFVSNQQIGGFKSFEIPPIPLFSVVAFVVYFLLGYFLFATLFSGIGAAVDQEQDAQTISTPVYLFLIIPILFVSSVMADPDSTLSVVLSLIPPFTPILMIVRIFSTSVPLWQIVLSFILLILTIWGSVILSAKIYRIGILIYGKKPTFKEIYRWLSEA